MVSAGFVNGPSAAPTAAIAFIAAPLTVTVSGPTRFVHVTSNAALGGAGVANNLDLYICYRQIPGGTLTTVGLGEFGLAVAAGMRIPFELSAVFSGVAAGTYLVGLCGNSTFNAASWNNNEYSYTSAFVAQAGSSSQNHIQHSTRRSR